MLVLKKILIDIFFILLLLLLSITFGTIIKAQSPGCVTCGVTVATTFWLASVIALQPVLWATGLKKTHRFMVWVFAFLSGAFTYMALEYIGNQMLISGNIVGLKVGLYANLAFDIAALIISIFGVRYIKHKNYNSQPNK